MTDLYGRQDVADWLARLPVFEGERVVLDWLGPGRGRVAGDVGAGSGRLCGPLSARGFTYRAVDPSPVQIAELRRSHPGADAEVAGGERLPWSDSSIDVVLLAFHVIEAITSASLRSSTVKEAARVLRPGGILLLSHHRRSRYHLARQAVHWLRAPSRTEFGDLVLRGTPSTGGIDLGATRMHIPGSRALSALAGESGFEVVMRLPFKRRDGRLSRLITKDVQEVWRLR